MRPHGLGVAPRDLLTDPAAWPEGVTTHPVAEYAQEFARRLSVAMHGRSFRSVARDADMSHRTVAHILRGEQWPDVQSMARLERSLGWPLWPGPDLLAADLRAYRERWQRLHPPPGRRRRRAP